MLSAGEVTQLLEAIGHGSRQAVDKLFPLVYTELRGLAADLMLAERRGHTLQTTALVHEAYLRLVGQQTIGWRSRMEFFGVAAKAMRRILVDHARMTRSKKRGGGAPRIELDDAIARLEETSIDLVALDEALEKLAQIDARKSRVVELRFFGGLTAGETAQLLNCPLRSVERDWTMAKAWLRAEIGME